MLQYFTLAPAVCVIAASISMGAVAQQHPSTSVEEAQTPPRIDMEQLQTVPVHVPRNGSAQTTAVKQLQEAALAPLAQTEAARRQQANALWQLGLLYLHGLHVPLDAGQAAQMFDRAHKLGHPLASAGLVWCALDGCGKRPDLEKAKQWVEILRAQDFGRAAYFEWLLLDVSEPIEIHVEMSSTSAPQKQNSLPLKQQFLLKALRAKDIQARVEWGLELVSQGKKQEALVQFRVAAAKSEAAKRNIQILNEQISAQSARSKRTVHQAGAAWQTFRQARVYHRGEGVPVNYTEAIRLYKRAADMGSEAAKRMLALIYSRPQSDGSLDIAWMQQVAYADVTQESTLLINAPVAPSSLSRDPTPLYDYIAQRWLPAS